MMTDYFYFLSFGCFTSAPLSWVVGLSVLAVTWLSFWEAEGTMPCAYCWVISTKSSRSTSCVAEKDREQVISWADTWYHLHLSLLWILTLFADHALQYFLGLAWCRGRNPVCSATYWWEITTTRWVRNHGWWAVSNVIFFTRTAADSEITKGHI